MNLGSHLLLAPLLKAVELLVDVHLCGRARAELLEGEYI